MAKRPAIDPPKAAAAAAAATGAAVAAAAAVRQRRSNEPRAYRFLADEPLPEGIRRVARGRIDHARDELKGKTDSSPEKAVHEARKDIKKLRSLLRLIRDELGEELYRRENDCLRGAVNALSAMRDADVMLAALDSVKSAPVGLRQGLEAHREVLGAGGRAGRTAEAVGVLEGTRERVGDWPLERDGFEVLQPGLVRIYGRGRRAARRAESDATTENLHEWRKRVKDRWYHVTLLGECWPEPLGAEADEAHALSDLLGDDHDLAVLRAWAHEHLAGRDLGDFDAEIESSRNELQTKAFELGRRVYAERPKAFARRLGALFNASRAPEAERVV